MFSTTQFSAWNVGIVWAIRVYELDCPFLQRKRGITMKKIKNLKVIDILQKIKLIFIDSSIGGCYN